MLRLIAQLWSALGRAVGGLARAGGVICLAAGLLEKVMPPSLVVLVLFLLGAFGALVVTATRLNQLPGLVRGMFAAEAEAVPDHETLAERLHLKRHQNPKPKTP